MSAAPLELPVRATEAASLADIVFQFTDRTLFRDDVRNRIASRLAAERYDTLRPFAGSLAQDPVHAAAYFIAVDAYTGGRTTPLLLRLALATAPASALFPNATLVARTRSVHNREFVIGAIPFSPSHHKEIRLYVEEVDRGFMPRPHGLQSAVPVVPEEPETALPAAFQAFRRILRNSGQNMAAVVCAGADPERFLDVALWTAIRAGWREGFSAGIRVPLEGGIEAVRKAVRLGQKYTRFSLIATRGDLSELDLCVQVHAFITETKSSHRPWKHFDFELSLARSGVSSIEDVVYCLEYLKHRGCAVQSVAPDFGGILHPAAFDSRVSTLAEAVRPFHAALTIQGQVQRPSSVPPGARFNYEVSLSAAEEPARIMESVIETASSLRG